MLSASWTHTLRWITSLLVAAAATGCSTVTPGSGPGSLAGLLGGSQVPVVDKDQPSVNYSVELRPIFGKNKSKQFPLTQVTRVQDALAASGALRRFSNMEITVVRQSPAPDSPAVRLGATFDRKSRQVSIETDYALHPGDRVTVVERKPAPLEEMAESLVRPLRAPGG